MNEAPNLRPHTTTPAWPVMSGRRVVKARVLSPLVSELLRAGAIAFD